MNRMLCLPNMFRTGKIICNCVNMKFIVLEIEVVDYFTLFDSDAIAIPTRILNIAVRSTFLLYKWGKVRQRSSSIERLVSYVIIDMVQLA